MREIPPIAERITRVLEYTNFGPLWIIVAITLVWCAEAFNTALEQLADALHPENHPGIGRAKDVAAAAVLIAAVGAAVIGMLVFVPHFAGMAR